MSSESIFAKAILNAITNGEFKSPNTEDFMTVFVTVKGMSKREIDEASRSLKKNKILNSVWFLSSNKSGIRVFVELKPDVTKFMQLRRVAERGCYDHSRIR